MAKQINIFGIENNFEAKSDYRTAGKLNDL